ncbi:MAG: exodeoxyribonuclease V subunit beta [Betaproteobacteria bacterium]|nr:exodeoxyribonuclease V subunit beta [Betaproteobacteria bacterium]
MSHDLLNSHPALRTPLDGTSLIEASAGTGKTWTIVGLYLRLLLERGIAPRAILVVTFTNAATAELKERIRHQLMLLRDALAGATTAAQPGDPLIDLLVARIEPMDRPQALARIRLAVETFDEAAIHTIHGFCQRVLMEHAFVSGAPLEAEVRANQTSVVNAVARDFWRRMIGQASSFAARLLVAKGRDPESLVKAARPAMGAPMVAVLQPDAIDLDALGARLVEAYLHAAKLWSGERAHIEELLLSGALNGTRYPKQSVPCWCDELDRYFGHDEAPLDHPTKLENFAKTRIDGAVNKGKTAPRHALFAAVDQLMPILAEVRNASLSYWYRMVARFAIEGSAEVAKRKLDEGWQSYDDMLTRVHAALASDRAAAFATGVAACYGVALIDEFQDTDEVQYAILRQLFQDTGGTTVLVGDPKQAIYGFRGADVFAYLRARSSATHTFDLTVNRRSSGPLLDAINAVCGRGAGRFLLPEIAFKPALRPPDDGPVFDAQDGLPPFVMWLVPGAPGKPAHKGASRSQIAASVAAEIARLLGATGGAPASMQTAGTSRTVSGRDIAVLVGRHSEGEIVRAALTERNIASVTFNERSIFQTPEASDFAQLLAALVAPRDERLIRGALATSLFGMTLTDFAQFAQRPGDWEAILARFQHYRALMEAAGCVRVFREIVATTSLSARMLGAPGGERAMSNYQQLAELLHRLQRSEHLDIAGVLRALHRGIGQEELANDEEQLRLETDAALVRIMTIHRAKGLEFPIVFCPFLWDGQTSAVRTPPVRFHDESLQRAPVIDFGSPDIDAHRAIADTEVLAERIRIAYVALTRAKVRCYVVWGALKECGSSALAWLLHGPEQPGADLAAARQTLLTRLKTLSAEGFQEEVQALARQANGGMAVLEIPDPAASDPTLEASLRPLGRAVPFNHAIPTARRTSSFSGLMSNAEIDILEHDGLLAPQPQDERVPEDDIVAFPRGAKAGSCLHAVLERVLIGAPEDRQAWPGMAERAIDEFGLPARWRDTVVRMLDHVMTTPLDAQSALSLGGIPVAARLTEMEFWYPLEGDRSGALERIITLHRSIEGLPAVVLAAIPRVLAKGYMKGFIDLVFEHEGRFFVADYKSNWLGAAIADYASPALAANIATECYDLQYLLYTLAVDRYLAARVAGYDYERHYGGVYYLYLRGLRRERGAQTGVYFSRPSLCVVTALRALGGAVSS